LAIMGQKRLHGPRPKMKNTSPFCLKMTKGKQHFKTTNKNSNVQKITKGPE
jgi:hypothetical protein